MQLQVFIGECGRQYFTIGESSTHYDIAFPLDIALRIHNLPYVGHQNCANCRAYASFNHIATGICLNCCYITGFKQFACQCSFMDETVYQAMHNFEQHGFMTIGCTCDNCPHQTYLKDADFTTFALSQQHFDEHLDALAYQQFTLLFNYPL